MLRHFRSILYTLVLAPAVWVLTGVGLTGELTARGRDGFAVEELTGLLLLLLAGTAYGILVLGPISPAGPLVGGVVYLGIALWAMALPSGYGAVWPAEVAKEGFDISRPGYGLAALLAVPLICTALSARRWEKHEAPVLPIIGPIRGFRGQAEAPGTPIAALQTTVLGLPSGRGAPKPSAVTDRPYPVTDPEPTMMMRLPADPTAMPAHACDDTTVVPADAAALEAAADALVEALEEEATLAGPPPMAGRTTTVVLSSDESAVVAVLSAGAASTKWPEEADAPEAAASADDEATEPVPAAGEAAEQQAEAPAGDEPTVATPAAQGGQASEPITEEVGDSVRSAAEAAEPNAEEDTEPVEGEAGSGEGTTADVPVAERDDATEPIAADDREAEESAAAGDEATTVAVGVGAEAVRMPVAGAAAGTEADNSETTQVVRLPVGAAGENRQVVRLPVGDAGESTQVVRLPVPDAGEGARPPHGDGDERTQVLRLPVGDAGERTQVLRFPVPGGAEQTHDLRLSPGSSADTTQVLRFPVRPGTDGPVPGGPGERTRDLRRRATGDVGGDETQVIRLPGKAPDAERTQVIRPGLVTPPGERTEVLQFPRPAAAAPVSIADAESPNFAEDPTSPIVPPGAERDEETTERSMTVTKMERPADELAEDPTVHIEIPAQRRPGGD